jgi:MFS family permease
MDADQTPLYTTQFWLLCLSSFLFSVSFNLMIPELPDYLSNLGGAEYKGLIIALFTLMAGISRPFSGKLTDTIGRIPVMAFGSLVCFVCGFIYPFLTTVAGLLILRFFHGFSTGFKPTGTSAYVADIVPEARRGEALGVNGLAMSMGMSVGPLLGSWITSTYSINTMFYASSVSALLSIIILLNMQETLSDRQRFAPRLLALNKHEIVEREAFPPAIVYLLVCVTYGAVFTLAPDLSRHLGIQNKGLFFSVFTLASLAVRFFAGKISDRMGRIPVVMLSMVFYAASMGILAYADTVAWLMAGAIVFGIGLGMNSPSIFAWAIDLSHDQNRGKSLATVYIALEAGIGLGALGSAWVYDNKPQNFGITFLLSGAFVLVGMVYLWLHRRKLRR